MASRGFIELLRLADLANARQTGRGDPNQEDWLGVVFEVAGQQLVAPLGEISEVLGVPEFTAMPLTKEWLLGVANVRGRLLPLTDLAQFVGLGKTHRQGAKVMVLDKADVFSGLMVDQVTGINRFDSRHYVGEGLPVSSPFAPFGHGKFIKDDEEFFVFMPSLLIKDTRYMNAQDS